MSMIIIMDIVLVHFYSISV